MKGSYRLIKWQGKWRWYPNLQTFLASVGLQRGSKQPVRAQPEKPVPVWALLPEEQAQSPKALGLPVGVESPAGAAGTEAPVMPGRAGPCRQLSRRAALPRTAATLPPLGSFDWVLPETDYKCWCRFCGPFHSEEKSLIPTLKPTSRM